MFQAGLFVLMFTIIFVLPASQQKELPKYIHKCSMKHNIKECVLKNGNAAIPYIVKGDPEYHVPSLMPLHVPFMSLSTAPGLSLNLTDILIYGLDHTKFIDFIPKNGNILSFTAVFAVPKATVVGQYSASGKVLIMPIEGKGNFSMILNNGVYTYTDSIEAIQINGETYYKTHGNRLTYQLEKVSFDIGNLFSGDEKFGAQINKFLNENWKDLVTDFGPGVSETATEFIKRIFNSFTKDVPAKNIFLPD